MSGNDARYDADSAVLVAAKQKAALQEHAKMQWLACFDSALSAAEVGLERKQRERRAAQRAAEAQDAARGQRNRPAPSRC
ncbi:hypothetical protein EMIHUDRAFT_252508 [Emiliania huxleyi CCMP1516]|uniref:Uncharacterized protein n=2 Tax=Emiliania huxleyi TaxID=2903 RepID=A0A0D3KJG6_EMIH1|nr:hypothetical protein EMIHUDRAFT_252508 [Emiliania huxleyi CCMP1516]EOD35901.1 hypothetical protein EMIHUDRAFT_252508 [Emiliania huxleyi CCMP1516]|eukprot:XP_005788330.1 hypothetical protein EMIHUDRAFT_252508 [Emiliania huxleyi CCMP1516]